ncbi:MAG: signal peptidase I [Actinomycetota bacterium]|nr:signal peptidase I [Actinomycetota bacterium]
MSTQNSSAESEGSRWRYAPGLVLLAMGIVLSQWGCLAVCTGASMEPALSRGDLCVVARSREATVGDMVLFRSGTSRRPVLHRVIAVGKDGFLHTQGDANKTPDRSGVSPTEVSGTVIAVFRLGHRLGF